MQLLNSPIHPEQLLSHMPSVQQQRQELRLIEAAWDNLSLLSSLSTLSAKASSGGDLARARQDFAALSEEMMRGLSSEALKTALDDLGARAQVSIDILVRNLFERTADIGFFATDVAIADYLKQADASRRPAMEDRLRSYASKYTVYGNIYLFDAQSELQASLSPVTTHSPLVSAQDAAFLQEVRASQAAYTEHYAVHGFCADAEPTLLYAQPVAVAGQSSGVLCLQFKLADEAAAIFAQVQGDNPQAHDTVLALVSPQGQVLHSNDALQLPPGWQLPQAASAGTFMLRHLGRKYLAVVRNSVGFQGYTGPGWRGLAMRPLEGAFDAGDNDTTFALMDEVCANPDFLAGELSHIPKRSAAIQSALERSVWNGLLELNHLAANGSESQARDTLFAKTLLSEIGATAHKTAQAFACALRDLHEVVMRAMLRDVQHRADLAMQILDRNLYERANDCRWWALTPQFAATLQAGTTGCDQSTAVLQQINGLYTVYACLVLFDRQGKVLAVSQPSQSRHVGTVLDETWVAATLNLPGEQDYTVSPFAHSRFYADGPTYVYAAAVRNPQACQAPALGGIAIVWDAHTQMHSILQDCSEGMGTQDLLVFVDPSGQLLHSSPNGMQRPDSAPLLEAASGQAVIDMQDQLYGVGEAQGRGYREFGTVDHYAHGLRCQALRHLCPRNGKDNTDMPVVRQAPRVPAEHRLQMGTFGIAGHWLGLDVRYILKAAADTAVMSAGSTRPPMLGIAQIEGKVYQVLDLHSVIGAHGTAASDQPDPTRQMLVLQIPMPDGKQREFALRVDALGGIVDVDARTLQALRITTAPNAVSLIDAVVSITTGIAGTLQEADKQSMLCRIALAWLQQCSTGEITPQDLHLDLGVQRLRA